MSEGAAEGGGDAGSTPISDAQFGDVPDVPGGETVQNPGDGIFGFGFYTDHHAPYLDRRPPARHRKKRKKSR